MGQSLPLHPIKLFTRKLFRFSLGLAFSLGIAVTASAQNGSVGIGTNTPSDKAILEIKSDSKGLLIPKLTQQKRDELLRPGTVDDSFNGMLIYNSDAKAFNVWKTDNWVEIGGIAGADGRDGVNGQTAFELWQSLPGNAGKDESEFFRSLEGKSAYVLWLEAGNNGTEADFLLTLKGDKGVGYANAHIDNDGNLILPYNDGSGNELVSGGPVRGAQWYNGNDDPAVTLVGVDVKRGDLYLNNSSGDVFKKEDDVTGWVLFANLTTGVTGPVGPEGPTGPAGATGPAGEQGIAGPQGPAGEQGATGPTGAQGPAGPMGPVGPTGATGPAGSVGATGAQGPTGPRGLTGLTGATGLQGVQGEKGEKGEKGDKGDIGLAGPKGDKGENGVDGAAGLKGDTGDKGDKGEKGDAGPQGIPGEDGAQGPQGPIGLTGENGLGAKWHIGSSTPSAIIGEVNDLYLDNISGNVYEKTASGWGAPKANLKPASATASWALGGNSGSSPAVAGTNGSFIGTTDAKDFVFATDNFERVRIKADGKVGIATTDAKATLDVNGNFSLGQGGAILNVVLHDAKIADLPSIASGASHKQMFTVTGAVTIKSTVVVSPVTELPDGLLISYARVSASNTVEVKFYNASGAAIDVASGTFNITVVQ